MGQFFSRSHRPRDYVHLCSVSQSSLVTEGTNVEVGHLDLLWFVNPEAIMSTMGSGEHFLKGKTGLTKYRNAGKTFQVIKYSDKTNYQTFNQ